MDAYFDMLTYLASCEFRVFLRTDFVGKNSFNFQFVRGMKISEGAGIFVSVKKLMLRNVRAVVA